MTFINAESAEVYGIEFEGLKGLGFLSDGGWTESFFVAGNVTVSDSEITIGDAAPNLTNNKRDMTQHSDLVVNFQLGYDSPTPGTALRSRTTCTATASTLPVAAARTTPWNRPSTRWT